VLALLEVWRGAWFARRFALALVRAPAAAGARLLARCPRFAVREPRYFFPKGGGGGGRARRGKTIAGAGLIETIHWTWCVVLAQLRPYQQKG